MKQLQDKCVKIQKNKEVVVKEKKAEFRIENSQQKAILLIKVDKCLDFEGKKCDYFFDIEKIKQFFVELKGHQLNYAIEQLENTYENLKDYEGIIFNKVYFYVVMSRVPKLGIDFQRMQKQLAKKKITLKLSSRKMIIKI